MTSSGNRADDPCDPRIIKLREAAKELDKQIRKAKTSRFHIYDGKAGRLEFFYDRTEDIFFVIGLVFIFGSAAIVAVMFFLYFFYGYRFWSATLKLLGINTLLCFLSVAYIRSKIPKWKSDIEQIKKDPGVVFYDKKIQEFREKQRQIYSEIKAIRTQESTEFLKSYSLLDGELSSSTMSIYNEAVSKLKESYYAHAKPGDSDIKQLFFEIAAQVPELFGVNICNNLPEKQFVTCSTYVISQLIENKDYIKIIRRRHDNKPEFLLLVNLLLIYDKGLYLLNSQKDSATLLCELTKEIINAQFSSSNHKQILKGTGRCPECRSHVKEFWRCDCGCISCEKCVKKDIFRNQYTEKHKIPGYYETEKTYGTIGPDTLGGGWIQGEKLVRHYVPEQKITEEWNMTTKEIKCPKCNSLMDSQTQRTSNENKPAEGGMY